ncbi:fimbrial protein [Providencia sneebia]|uniref:Uncharacterized protein n=1 Tax=Providencia sneebia DSM 19967 TaxID=1141660 RepID=K8WK91_9GAMM|nr:fimbrial protein [Providencia sneebia]EKT60969.1 hypothetical protein OO7_02741 [Providencia sneebia DSM 19967]
MSKKKLLILFILSSFELPSSFSATNLNVDTYIIEGSCDISAPAEIRFIPKAAIDFVDKRTADLKELVITVSNCRGSSLIRSPSIMVTGNLLAGSNDIFAEASSVAKNVGVGIREGNGFNLKNFYVPGNMVSSFDKYTHVGAPGSKMKEGQYTYTLGFVNNGKTPTIGKMTAKLIFEFKYK